MRTQSGTVFQIQKFCLHDGPGIRTTIFLKGCPMRCRWCANPESQSFRIQLTIDHRVCTGCGMCASACSRTALSRHGGKARVDANICDGCGGCVNACPQLALALQGAVKNVDEICFAVMQDELFYNKSGGGVTFSGGEPMCQPEFLIAAAARLQANRVHTAVETAGFVPAKSFRHCIEPMDLLLFDIKHYDPVLHKEGTGVDNALILANLACALALEKPVVARIPVIPGYNDAPGDALRFADLFRKLGVFRVDLLPFHRLGESKYSLLGLEYVYAHQKTARREALGLYAQILLDAGVTASIVG